MIRTRAVNFTVDAAAATVAAVALATFTQASAQDSDADELARQATDPTASLMAFNFILDYTGDYHGPARSPNDAWNVSFRPVIPFQAFGASNILRLTLPYQLSGPGDDGLGDVSVFDLVVFNESWGRWGVGAVASLATSDDAPDDIAVGPAIGAVYQYSKRLNLGLFSQNVFAGDTGVSSLQPIVAYQLGDGWSLSGGDLQFVYDWQRSRWLSVPLGFQIGKVTKLGGQPVRWAINPQYNLIDDEGLEEWSIAITFALLVPSR
jgi:hypothetical protein